MTLMNVFIPKEITFNSFLAISIFYFFVVFAWWWKNVKLFDYPNWRQPLLVLFIIIHLLFAYDGGDYFSYYERIREHDLSGIEPIYSLIAKSVHYNYLLFRLLIWGSALLVFMITAKRFKLDPYKTAYILYVLYFSTFDYARVSLAMAIYTFGISFLCLPKNGWKVCSYLIGFLFIGCSVIFHRSMVFPVLASAMAFVPLNKKNIILVIIAFFASVPLLNYGFNLISSGQFFSNQDINQKISDYAVQSFQEGFSIYEWIRRGLQYATFFVPFIFISFMFHKSEVIENDGFLPTVRLFKVTFGILLLAVSTLMVDLESFIVFYRFLFISMLPLTLLICLCRKQHLITHGQFLSFLYLSLFCSGFGVFKRLLGGNLA